MQSVVLLTVMASIAAIVGELLWGSSLLVVVGTVAGMLLVARAGGTTSALLRLYRGRLLAPHEAPQLHAAVAELGRRAGLPRPPGLAYVPSPMVNAFATGRKGDSVVVLTDGILRSLDLRELVAVLAHEVAHVRNHDLWVMAVADLMSRLTHAVSAVAQIVLVLSIPAILRGELQPNWLAYGAIVFAPTLAVLAQLGLSRTREFHADLNAVALTGDPEGLASALLKLERSSTSWWERVLLPGRHIPEPSYLRTHPTTEERVARLRNLSPRSRRPVLPTPAPASPPPPRTLRPPRWRMTGLWY